MAGKKKGGKGKKGKKGKKVVEAGPTPVTTVQILEDRTKMLCPRLGDVYFKSMQVETILEDVADRFLKKVSNKQMDTISLKGMKLTHFPDVRRYGNDLMCLTNLDLAKNQLFNGDELFKSLTHVKHLVELNLSENFLNGMLSDYAGQLENLEVLNLDVNNLTGLCPAVSRWTKLRVFTISDNSLTSKYSKHFIPNYSY